MPVHGAVLCRARRVPQTRGSSAAVAQGKLHPPHTHDSARTATELSHEAAQLCVAPFPILHHSVLPWSMVLTLMDRGIRCAHRGPTPYTRHCCPPPPRPAEMPSLPFCLWSPASSPYFSPLLLPVPASHFGAGCCCVSTAACAQGAYVRAAGPHAAGGLHCLPLARQPPLPPCDDVTGGRDRGHVTVFRSISLCH